MFNSQAKVDAARVEGRKDFVAALLTWHKKVAEQQASLERTFTFDAVPSFSVNVWDDYAEDEGTYAYVEMRDVPDRVCCDVLLHVLAFAKAHPKINATGSTFGLRFYDSSTIYPSLIGRQDTEYSMFKRWEITIDGANHDALDVIVSALKAIPPYQGKPIKIYSES